MKKIALIIGCLGLVGCAEPFSLIKSLGSTTEFTRGYLEECQGTGLLIETGVDLDQNGKLTSSEVDDSAVVCDARDGQDGTNGVDGRDGIDGVDGTDGQDGESGVVEIVDPCGDGQGHDEVVLMMPNGQALVWYADLGLTILDENRVYRTTDFQGCRFKVVNGEVVEI